MDIINTHKLIPAYDRIIVQAGNIALCGGKGSGVGEASGEVKG